MAFPSPPNFDQLAKQFAETSAHLKLLADSPDVHQGNLLVKALNDINSRLGNIDKSIKDLHDQVAHVRDSVDARERQITADKAAAWNTSARASNRNAWGELTPLRHYLTNMSIDGFPARRDLTRYLDAATVTNILNALNYQITGNADQNQNTLSLAIGIS